MTHTQSKYVPIIYQDVLGISGFTGRSSTMFCLIVNNGNRFISDGIVKGSLLFVDKAKPYLKNALNVFQRISEAPTEYVLSKEFMGDAVYCGRVVITINQYEDAAEPDFSQFIQPISKAAV